MFVTIEEDENGDFILPLPDELCGELEWKVGDTLRWHDNLDGTISITKVITQ